jgi:hypothetical protein
MLEELTEVLLLVDQRYEGQASAGGEIDPGKRMKSRRRPQVAEARNVGFPDDIFHPHIQAQRNVRQASQSAKPSISSLTVSAVVATKSMLRPAPRANRCVIWIGRSQRLLGSNKVTRALEG